MIIISLIYLSIACIQQLTAMYRWVELNDRFDCVVGITLYGKPIGIGTMTRSGAVITSANPLQKYWWDSMYHVGVHRISQKYDRDKKERVTWINGNQSYRNTTWVPVGYNDSSHSTIHDIMIIHFSRTDEPLQLVYPKTYRRLGFAKLALDETEHPLGWYFAGFGYLDETHIKTNTVLEVTYLEDSDRLDCDEWLPREWGRFICFKNVENLPALPSGAPLLHAYDVNLVYKDHLKYKIWVYEPMVIYGIGSFILTKESESILVFTDLKPYAYKVDGLNDYQDFATWQKDGGTYEDWLKNTDRWKDK